ncbi:MAG: SPOR domain-containing protein [Ahrensia sp.]|nr:SPOR domain-containing protein [Ahrensia sp.]
MGRLIVRRSALDYLRDAQTKAKSVLAKRDPFVEVFEKGAATYHRARFAGFASKTDAWNACSALKKYKYSCVAYQK